MCCPYKTTINPTDAACKEFSWTDLRACLCRSSFSTDLAYLREILCTASSGRLLSSAEIQQHWT